MKVLIVVDMQEALFTNAPRFDADGVINRINLLVETIRSQGGKIIFIKHDGNKDDGLAPYTHGWEIISKLNKSEDDIVVRKTSCDAFYKTGLKKILDNMNPEKIIFTGCATDFCVDSSIKAAVSLDYNVAVASDGHTTADRPHMKAEDIINHHNFMWENLITPDRSVSVNKTECILRLISNT